MPAENTGINITEISMVYMYTAHESSPRESSEDKVKVKQRQEGQQGEGRARESLVFSSLFFERESLVFHFVVDGRYAGDGTTAKGGGGCPKAAEIGHRGTRVEGHV
jgi:hypothetical protein